MNTISFPGLGIAPFEVSEVAFSVFGMDIAWYALIITFGMVLAVTYTIFRAKKIGVTFDDVVDFEFEVHKNKVHTTFTVISTLGNVSADLEVAI